MAYREFIIPRFSPRVPEGDKGDKGDKTTLPVESVAPVAHVAPARTFKKHIWRRAEVMALPVMPCTTCLKFKWSRRPSCEKYQSLADPKKGCRCIHYEERMS